MNFRTLQANEIECRVGTQDKGCKWCTLLLYKDARVDQRLLDEVVGATRWQRSHELIDGQLFCTVSIYDADTKQWVSKQDVGTESNTEKEKGRASDAFKRACFNWGIGRELYTAPFIFIKDLNANDFNSGKLKMGRFKVKSIAYDEQRNVSELTIVDSDGNVRFTMGGKGGSVRRSEAKKAPEPAPAPAPQATHFDIQGTKLKICGITTADEGYAIYNATPEKHKAEVKQFVCDQFDILGIPHK